MIGVTTLYKRIRLFREMLTYWRTVTGEEVDFVFEVNGKINGLECKLTSSPLVRHARGLERFMDLLPEERRGQGLLVCLRDRAGRLGRTRVVPFRRFRQLRNLKDLF